MESPDNGPDFERSSWLQTGLRELYEEKRHCDITIHVEESQYSCHKVVLSAVSKYFDAMFSSGMKEASTNVVKLKEVRADVIEDVLAFVYGDFGVIQTDNVEALLQASSLLQIPSLQARCERFLITHLCPKNCIGVWLMANTYNCKLLQNASLRCILDCFDEVCESEEFVKLDKEDLITIIKNNKLRASNEEIVCRAVFRWLKADAVTRKPYTEDLFLCLRLCQVSVDFLLDEVDDNPLFSKNKTCKAKVKDAIRYLTIPGRTHNISNVDLTFRESSKKRAVLLVLGRRVADDGNLTTEVVAFCPRDGKWFSLLPPPLDVGDDFATCPYGNDIFITGGTSNPKATLRFSAKSLNWAKKGNMEQGRYRHCMVAVRDSLFCLGGHCGGLLKAVEEFDLATETWQTVGALNLAVDTMTASAVGESIFVFGGWLGFADNTAAVQCFDTLTGVCTTVASLPSPCRGARSLRANDKIYVVMATGEVVAFDHNHRVKVVDMVRGFNRQKYGVHLEGNTLYVMGGESAGGGEDSEEKTSDEIITLSRNSRETSPLPSRLPAPLEVYSCQKTVLHVKYPLTEFGGQFV